MIIQIKAKPGYNIIINDINIALRAENDQWIPVDKEVFEASADAKKLKDFIVIDETGKEKNKELQIGVQKATKIGSAQVVGKSDEIKGPDSEGVFMATAEKSENTVEKLTTEIVDKPVVEPTELEAEPTEVVETLETHTTKDLETEVASVTEEVAAKVEVKADTKIDTKKEDKSKKTGRPGRPSK